MSALTKIGFPTVEGPFDLWEAIGSQSKKLFIYRCLHKIPYERTILAALARALLTL